MVLILFSKSKTSQPPKSTGQRKNGNMGVAIAVPKKYTIVSMKKHRMSDGKDWPPFPNEADADPNESEDVYSNWKQMKARENRLILLELTCGTIRFFLGLTTVFFFPFYGISSLKYSFAKPSKLKATVHMPASWISTAYMTTFCALALQFLQRHASNAHLIFCGDFNVTPTSPTYTYFQTGVYDKQSFDADYPPHDLWRPPRFNFLQSALLQVHGAEPNMTIYTHPLRNECLFKETLDYIFVSSQIKALDAFQSPKMLSLCPNEVEPSDHLLIWCLLEMK